MTISRTLSLTIGLGVSLAALGGAMAQDKTMAFSPLSLDIPAMQGLSGALNHFADEAGIGYMTLDPKYDATTQAQQLAQVIETGRVTGAWAITIGAPALRGVVQSAVERGVPMVVSGRPADYGFDEPQPGIAFSDIDYEAYGSTIGRELGNCIAERFGGEGRVFFFGDVAATAAAEITDNFGKSALALAAPDAQIVATNTSKERLESQQKVSQMLLAHADANAVYASSDENAMGALFAFEAAGLPTPCIVSGGGSDEVLDAVAAGKIYASAGFDFQGDAYQNFHTLLAMMDKPDELGPILSIPIKLTK
jgi:ribose transport system substrate-binding protein